MMYNYPFYNRRFSRYYNYQNSNYIQETQKQAEHFIPLVEPEKEIIEDRNNKEDFLFEVFGIKLYYDDILILFLIYFLYKEGVNDLYLYIALFLLFIS